MDLWRSCLVVISPINVIFRSMFPTDFHSSLPNKSYATSLNTNIFLIEINFLRPFQDWHCLNQIFAQHVENYSNPSGFLEVNCEIHQILRFGGNWPKNERACVDEWNVRECRWMSRTISSEKISTWKTWNHMTKCDLPSTMTYVEHDRHLFLNMSLLLIRFIEW